MKYVIWIASISILILLQTAVLKPLHLFPVNAVLVLMILVLLFEGLSNAMIIAIAGGMMLDFLAGTNLGLMTLSLIFVLVALQAMLELFLTRELHWPMIGVLVVISSLGWGLIFLAVNGVFAWFGRGVAINFTGFWTNELWLVFFNLVLTYPIFKYLSLTRWVYAKSVRN